MLANSLDIVVARPGGLWRPSRPFFNGVGGNSHRVLEDTIVARPGVAVAALPVFFTAIKPEGDMLTINARDLYRILMGDTESFEGDTEETTDAEIPAEVVAAVQALDIDEIVVDFGMSENRIGGDDVVSIVSKVLDAQRNQYEIFVWYGKSDTSVMVIGYRADELSIIG